MEENELVKRSRAKMLQVTSRAESERRGRNGRQAHKGGSRSTNKQKGGRMAR